GRLRGRQPAPAIAYAASPAEVGSLTEALARAGVDAIAYHSAMWTGDRAEARRRFLGSGSATLVSTFPLGSDLDKVDVRAVYLLGLPPCPEVYWQAAGQAGRDGRPAVAELLFGADEVAAAELKVAEAAAGSGAPAPAALASLVGDLLGRGVHFYVSTAE